MKYICRGAVRGDCGHQHRSIRTAGLCLDRDRAGCIAQGGYSDRMILRSTGEELDPEEYYEAAEDDYRRNQG